MKTFRRRVLSKVVIVLVTRLAHLNTVHVCSTCQRGRSASVINKRDASPTRFRRPALGFGFWGVYATYAIYNGWSCSRTNHLSKDQTIISLELTRIPQFDQQYTADCAFNVWNRHRSAQKIQWMLTSQPRWTQIATGTIMSRYSV